MSGVTPIPVTLRAADGRELAGLLLEARAPRGAICINGAAGYPREFYLRFAAYSAERGYHALLYDYRGVGASARAPLSNDPARMSEWGRFDMPAALEWLAQRFPRLPLFTVGHSIGGQLGAATSNQALARAHVMLAASTGYWRHEPAPLRYAALFFWFLYGPLTLRLFGYVPHSWVWRGRSLPRGVFLQWRRWCLRPEHFGPDLASELPDNQFAQCTAPAAGVVFQRRSDRQSRHRRGAARLLPRTRASSGAGLHRRRPACAASATTASSPSVTAIRCGARCSTGSTRAEPAAAPPRAPRPPGGARYAPVQSPPAPPPRPRPAPAPAAPRAAATA